MTPTLALPPVPIGWTWQDADGDPYRAFASQTLFTPFTPLVNVTGQPAMSVPLHWSDDGLPIGVQFIGAAVRRGDADPARRAARAGAAVGRPAPAGLVSVDSQRRRKPEASERAASCPHRRKRVIGSPASCWSRSALYAGTAPGLRAVRFRRTGSARCAAVRRRRAPRSGASCADSRAAETSLRLQAEAGRDAIAQTAANWPRLRSSGRQLALRRVEARARPGRGRARAARVRIARRSARRSSPANRKLRQSGSTGGGHAHPTRVSGPGSAAPRSSSPTRRARIVGTCRARARRQRSSSGKLDARSGSASAASSAPRSSAYSGSGSVSRRSADGARRPSSSTWREDWLP